MGNMWKKSVDLASHGLCVVHETARRAIVFGKPQTVVEVQRQAQGVETDL